MELLTERLLGSLVRGWGLVAAALLLLLAVPMLLWTIWSDRGCIACNLSTTFFVFSIAWAGVSAVQHQRRMKDLGLTAAGATALFSGPRPTDPDELRAWRWGWQFGYAIIAALAFLILDVIVGLMTGNGHLG